MIEQPTSTVAEYIAGINSILSMQYGRVKGEVTSINTYGKAIYFTIKDKHESALLSCLIWTSLYHANGIELNVGDEIIISGTPDIYAPTGRFSFKANTIEYAGEGALKQAYDKLKLQLEQQGLLAAERKRALPAFPKKIGVITSMSGTVIHDFSNNLDRRGYTVSIVDSRVEGKDAIHDLLNSLKTLAKQDIEALVIIRGGGSWESLQAFNTESVVREIASFKVPVITGIGHDADVTLAELVADIGCSTPTAVAEALNAPWDGLESRVALYERQTVGTFQALLNERKSALRTSAYTVSHSFERQLAFRGHDIQAAAQTIARIFSGLSTRIHEVNNSLLRASGIMKSNLTQKRISLARTSTRLQQTYHTRLRAAREQGAENFRSSVRRQAEAVREASRTLGVLELAVTANDPKRNIRLGYSLSFVNGKLARSVKDVARGSVITTQLADGEFTSEVKGVK